MDAPVAWSAEAEENLKKVPPFVRDMAKAMIEEFARGEGAREITPELMKRARAKFGM